MNERIIKVSAIVVFACFYHRMNFASKELFVFTPTIRQTTFSFLRRNGRVVPKVRAASIEISCNPKESSPVNTAGGVARLI